MKGEKKGYEAARRERAAQLLARGDLVAELAELTRLTEVEVLSLRR